MVPPILPGSGWPSFGMLWGAENHTCSMEGPVRVRSEKSRIQCTPGLAQGREPLAGETHPGGEAVFWGWISQLSLNQPCSEHSGRNGAGGRDRGSPSWWGTSLLDRTVCNCGGPVKRTGRLLQHKSHRFPIKGSHSEAQCSAGSLPRILCAVTHLSCSACKSRAFSQVGTPRPLAALPRCSLCCGPCLFICQRAKKRTHLLHCLSTWPLPSPLPHFCGLSLYLPLVRAANKQSL